MRKFLFYLVTAITIFATGLFTTVSAASPTNFQYSLPGWGTKEEGIIPKFDNAYPPYHNAWVEPGGFPNADFEEGFMYWSCPSRNNKPAEVCKIVEEDNGNHYITFTPKVAYDGVESVPFVENRLSAGDDVCLVVDWRGDPNFQVYLNQILYKDNTGTKKDTVRIQHSGGAGFDNLITEGENGWNTNVYKYTIQVQKPYDAMPDYYFNYGVQVCADTSTTAEIDNIRLGIFNASSNTIYDLDGNIMFDIDNLDTVEGEDLLNAEMFPEFDYDVTYDDIYSKNADHKSIASKDKADKNTNTILPILIVCGAIILISASATVIIIVKKKRANPANTEIEQ